nr:hypothetical protein [Tanacetum cinerariifolium]
MVSRFEAQELEINSLNARIKLLEDKDRGVADQSEDDAPIKGRSLDVGEEAVESVSDDTEKMATILTSMDAASILTSGGVQVVPTAVKVATATVSIPTGSGVVSTAGLIIPTAALIFTTATESTPYTRRKGKEKMVESDTPKKKKLQEQLDVQVTRELEEQMAKEYQRMFERIARDAEVARIHAEEELQMMINRLDRSNETVVKYLQEYEQIPKDLSIGERIELISDLTKDFKGMSFEQIKEKFNTVWKQIEDFIPMGSNPFEELSDIGSTRADDHEYLMMLEDPYVEVALQAPPSPDYMPGPEEPEQAPPSPDYILESDFEMHPEDDDDEDPEEDPVDYPADGGDGGDDEEESSEDDEDEEDDEMDVEADDEEEEEHPAPADSVVVAPTATDQALSAEETEPFETDESAATPAPPPSPIRSLGYRAAMIRLRDKRLDIALGPRYEVGESSSAAAARPAGGFRADYGFVATVDREIMRDPEREIGYGITDSWDEIVETLQGTPVSTDTEEIMRDPEREVGYGITDSWDKIVETLQGGPVSTDTELGGYMRVFETKVRQDTDEIYMRLDDEQSERQLLAGRLNMLFRDRQCHKVYDMRQSLAVDSA